MLAAAQLPAAPILAVMGFGVLVAIAGHVVKARWLVVTGLMLVFLSTAGMIVGGLQAYQQGESDPRPTKSPSEPGF
jgi:predicted metal-binding membrane protein